MAVSRNAKRDRDDPSVSAAKIGLIGTLGVAAVAAIASIVVAVVNDDDVASPPEVVEVAGAEATGELGSISSVTIDRAQLTVRVEGRAAQGVHTVLVSAGPNPATGTYWAERTDTSGGTWIVELKIAPPPVPDEFEVSAFFDNEEYEDFEGYDDWIECLEDQGSACARGRDPVSVQV